MYTLELIVTLADYPLLDATVGIRMTFYVEIISACSQAELIAPAKLGLEDYFIWD